MEKHIYTYALIKSLAEDGEDYIDCFWPFIIKLLPKDSKAVYLTNIQDGLMEEYDLQIPFHTLKTIIKRAQSKHYIEKKAKKFLITSRGVQYSETLETEKEVDRRLNELIEDLRQFLQEKTNIALNKEQIKEKLYSFIQRYINSFIEFLNPNIKFEIEYHKADAYDGYLIEYLKVVEYKKPSCFNNLKDIILGSIISLILSFDDISDSELKKKFSHCQVFLDTNFVFFLLGLHTKEFNEPAKELFNLLKKNKLELKVFSFTLDEICSVMKGYLEKGHTYPTTIMVDTLYSSLRIKGWTKEDAIEFIMNIENKLSDLGIQIEWVKDIDLSKYIPPNDDILNILEEYKPKQNRFHQNHDFAAIEKIKKIRSHTVRKIEDSKALFLTSDIRLSRFNYNEMEHRNNGTLSEVILDRLLTNILWLKNPSTEVPLKSLIAAHSRNLFVRRRVWERFYQILKELRQEERTDDEAISTLFFHNYIEDALKDIDETEIEEITEDFVLENIEKASTFKEIEIERGLEVKLEEKEEEFKRMLEEKITEKDREENEKWLSKITKIKENVGKSSERKSKKYSIMIASLLTIIIASILYFLIEILKDSHILYLLITTISGAGGLIGIWIKLRSYFESKLFNRINIIKLKEVGLYETKA